MSCNSEKKDFQDEITAIVSTYNNSSGTLADKQTYLEGLDAKVGSYAGITMIDTTTWPC